MLLTTKITLVQSILAKVVFGGMPVEKAIENLEASGFDSDAAHRIMSVPFDAMFRAVIQSIERTNTTERWIEIALAGEYVMNIGQIDAVTARALDKLVKTGALAKFKARFAGISPLKTVWARPDCWAEHHGHMFTLAAEQAA